MSVWRSQRQGEPRAARCVYPAKQHCCTMFNRNWLPFHVGSQRKARRSLERKKKKGLWPFHYLFLRRIAYKQVPFPHCRLCCKYCDGNKRKCPRAVIHSLHAQAKIFQPEKESVPLRTALAKAKLIKTIPSVCPRTASRMLSGLVQVTPR